jgi:hypothetical protein
MSPSSLTYLFVVFTVIPWSYSRFCCWLTKR